MRHFHSFILISLTIAALTGCSATTETKAPSAEKTIETPQKSESKAAKQSESTESEKPEPEESEPATKAVSNNARSRESSARIADGDYRDGLDSGELGLEVQASQFRHTSEGGPQEWKSIRKLTFIKEGVVMDERDKYWCQSSLKPKSENQRFTCSEKGWVPVQAATRNDDRRLLFSCLTENDKKILLYDAGETIDYSFGSPGAKPELSLQVPRSQASTWQWKGVGRWMSYSVDVPNGDTTYTIFWGFDRLSENRTVDAGVRVFINKKIATTVNCTSNIENKMQGVDLKAQDLPEN